MIYKGKKTKNRRIRSGKISKEIRQKMVAERDEVAAKQDPHERLRILDRRLGEGVGAVKERARLQLKIEEKNDEVP